MSAPTDQPVGTDPPQPPSTGTTAESSAMEPVPPARRRGSASAMLMATLAIAALVILQVLLVPRPTSVPRPSVDLASAADVARSPLGFEPAVTVPPNWTVTSADVRTDSGGLPTWTVNYLTDAGRYVGLLQAPGWNARWQSSLTHGGTPGGELTAGGHTWVVLQKPEKEITSLMLREAERTTLILAKGGGVADARVLADRVKLGP